MSNSQRFGQWIGGAKSENGKSTLVVFNVERRTPERGQLLMMTPENSTVADATVKFVADRVFGRISNYRLFDPQQDTMIPVQQLWADNPAAFGENSKQPPETADYEGVTDGDTIKGSYKYDNGLKGDFEFRQTFHSFNRENVPLLRWEEFKSQLARFRGHPGVLFRGQISNRLPLQTLFHRSGRNDLIRYAEEDLPRLRHQINAVSKHFYQLRGEDYSALLSLAQHHGYPTPLLDWSRSPYIAAFFAFDCLNDCDQWKQDRAEPVRVFAFETPLWTNPQVQSVKDPRPHLQFIEASAHNNPRFVPQQSVSSYSNVSNIEAFVSYREKQDDRTYLIAFDILPSERDVAIEDLRLMGITASALFPGFEGICRSLRLQFFR
jgi:hypothetical protein